MQVSGWVRDLREVMSLANRATSTPSADLVAAVTSFGAGATRAAQRDDLDATVDAWATTTGKLVGGSSNISCELNAVLVRPADSLRARCRQ
ncbi:MAG: hypothetical protein JNM90_22295 [Burkholderiales bacterium]|nr:hypothetical protein [Burkholderiales bacterium]